MIAQKFLLSFVALILSVDTVLATAAVGPVLAPEAHSAQFDRGANCNERQLSPTQFISSPVRLLNWNVQKAQHPQMQPLLKELSMKNDLILIQEAVLTDSFLATIESSYWDFAPGYLSASGQTGVLTASRIEASEHCWLSASEPWLGTPKAASVSRFALADSEETMLVINIHGINFTIGTEAFSEQLEMVTAYLNGHVGPVIFAGDFNTWSDERFALLESIADQYGLQSLIFANDNRKRFLGQALDHIYTRGFKVRSADTLITDTSDHNIMMVELEQI